MKSCRPIPSTTSGATSTIALAGEVVSTDTIDNVKSNLNYSLGGRACSDYDIRKESTTTRRNINILCRERRQIFGKQEPSKTIDNVKSNLNYSLGGRAFSDYDIRKESKTTRRGVNIGKHESSDTIDNAKNKLIYSPVGGTPPRTLQYHRQRQE